MDKWQNIQDANGGKPSNLLEAFYQNPERYAYTFQNYVFVTRLMQVRAHHLSDQLAWAERSAADELMHTAREPNAAVCMPQ